MNRDTLAAKVIETCLQMEKLGLNQGTSGNVSARFEDGMLITPTGLPYDAMGVEDIVFVNNNGEFEKNKVPSSEYNFHLACYEVRKEVNGVVHNHATNCTAVSILNRPIPAVHYMVAATGTDSVPCVPYATFGTRELSKYVADGIAKSKAILMQHHGMIAVEQNLEKALWLAMEIETLASIYLKLLSVTSQPPVLDSKKMEEVFEKFASYGIKTK